LELFPSPIDHPENRFTTDPSFVRFAQMSLRKIALSLTGLLLLTGCSTSMSNLTPHSLPRNPNNLYPFEVEFATTQKSIRENTLKPYVMIGTEMYPMKRTPMLKNRFEAAVPVPPTTNYIYYRYKFDYDYDKIGSPGQSSRLSPTYQLEIVDK